MAFIPIDRLRKGNTDFLYEFSTNDKLLLINQVRSHPDRINIINGFIDKLKDINPYFCYEIIYDIPEYSSLSYYLLMKYYKIENLDLDMITKLLSNKPLAIILLKNHFDKFLNKGDEVIALISDFVLNNKNELKEAYFILSRNKNMHIRYLFMKWLIIKKPNLVNIIYDDIFKYFINYSYEENEQLTLLPTFMDIKEICELALLFLKSNNFIMFNKIKEYILTNYKSNYLAYMLDKSETYILGESSKETNRKEKIDRLKKKMLYSDLDRLFVTSSTYKIHLYQDYHRRLSKMILNDFENRIKYFRSDKAISATTVSRNITDPIIRGFFRNCEGLGLKLSHTYEKGLEETLNSYVDKYLALSKRTDYEFVGEGSSCAAYRIGDYVFKLIEMKWSYEDEICPNIYLILKNLEEVYLRDNNEHIVGGIEVQKYLKRSARDIDSKYLELYQEELDNLGYFYTDCLLSEYGENVRLLDSYLEADTKDVELLPEWFKEYPIVLIDRDMVYKKSRRRFIKHL